MESGSGRMNRGAILQQAVVLPLVGVLQEQLSSLRRIRGRGTRTRGFASDQATAAGQIDRRIALTDVQQVNHATADIIRRYQPVGRDLSLDAEIPLIDID